MYIFFIDMGVSANLYNEVGPKFYLPRGFLRSKFGPVYNIFNK